MPEIASRKNDLQCAIQNVLNSLRMAEDHFAAGDRVTGRWFVHKGIEDLDRLHGEIGPFSSPEGEQMKGGSIG